MVGIDELALALAKAIGTEVSKRAGRGILDKTRAALGRDAGRQALQRAVRRALGRFDTSHAVWSTSFFDRHFLESRAAPLVARMVSTGDPPTSRELATAWREQFGPGAGGIEEVEPVAAAFLRILREELRAEDEFRAVLDSRAFDSIAEAVVTIAERMPDPARPPAASLPASPEDRSVWRVAAAAPTFTGREAELQQIRRDFAEAATRGQSASCAIHGLGGVRKSQLAAEYARRYRGDYEVGWWIRAEEESTRIEDLAALAYALGAISPSEGDHVVAARAARRWREQHDRWLLVLDDAPSPDELAAVVPHRPSGHVIVTSRRYADWRAAGARTLELRVWDRSDSVRFLLDRTTDQDATAASAIAQALGDLPLALEQAAAYTNRQRISLAMYAERLRDRDRDLLAAGAPRDYGRSVATTWNLAIEQVSHDPVTRLVLAVCAFLAPERIPREIFYSHVRLAATGGPATELLDSAIERLLGYSLLSADGASLTMHRLVQQLTRERMGPPGAQDALILMLCAFPRPTDDPARWPTCAELLPHALAALEHAEAAGVHPGQAIELLIATGSYLRVRGDLAAAQNVLERAFALALATFGSDDVRIVPAINDLGVVVGERSDLPRARELQQAALELAVREHGEDHPRTAGAMVNLATIVEQQGDLEAAKDLYEAALKTLEGAGNPTVTAAALVNLAIVLDQQADFSAARERHERALEIEMALDATHPRVGDTLVNLAITLQHLNELDAAKARFEAAISIFTSAFGGDHPKLARAVDGLATVLRLQGDIEGARQRHQSALDMAGRVYPPDHPEIARMLANLGIIARLQGDIGAALEKYATALEIQERTLGTGHTDVARTLTNIGLATIAQGDAAAARRLFARALRIQLKTHGPGHPEVVQLLGHLGVPTRGLTQPNQVAALLRALDEFLGSP
jgi:tetratricopeptide (TPR) repeat protein